MERDNNLFLFLNIIFISTHTLTWSVTSSYQHHHKLGWFQLTRSRGAWPIHHTFYYGVVDFNSHAHVERDVKSLITILRTIDFNSHAHVERDVIVGYVLRDECAFQLTRSRGAWLVARGNSEYQYHISTHTLTWSVTMVYVCYILWTCISTHTLTWSVT